MPGPSELPFEYVSRSTEIYNMMFPNPTPEQQRAIELMSQNQRDLEDFLKKTPSSSGGGAFLHTTIHDSEVGLSGGVTLNATGNPNTITESIINTYFPNSPYAHVTLSVKWAAGYGTTPPGNVAFRLMQNGILLPGGPNIPPGVSYTGFRVREGAAVNPDGIGVPFSWTLAYRLSTSTIDNSTTFGYQMQSFDAYDTDWTINLSVMILPGEGPTGGGT